MDGTAVPVRAAGRCCLSSAFTSARWLAVKVDSGRTTVARTGTSARIGFGVASATAAVVLTTSVSDETPQGATSEPQGIRPGDFWATRSVHPEGRLTSITLRLARFGHLFGADQIAPYAPPETGVLKTVGVRHIGLIK